MEEVKRVRGATQRPHGFASETERVPHECDEDDSEAHSGSQRRAPVEVDSAQKSSWGEQQDAEASIAFYGAERDDAD
ncbi:hypothetical protein DEI81_13775 [Curtobacterium sp. MCBD17_013]|nr:hypothetical protein DEI81_13775 [Curtobacterium sp. MCBD17_013]